MEGPESNLTDHTQIGARNPTDLDNHCRHSSASGGAAMFATRRRDRRGRVEMVDRGVVLCSSPARSEPPGLRSSVVGEEGLTGVSEEKGG
ncbi:hypothetical protein HanIR_Chr15g0777341 [Helianthus annuus]|nr:hypothetical protein HanIR_Chr15g0777341 [Helianthus annuus]